MKIKIIPLIMSAAIILSACSSSSSSTNSFDSGYYDGDSMQSSSAAISEEAKVPMSPNVTNSNQTNSITNSVTQVAEVNTQRKIVKNSRISLETKEFDNSIKEIEDLIANLGGYIESQSENGKSLYNNSEFYERSASIIARIPAEKLASAIDDLNGKYNIIEKNDYINDITDSYYDVEARLNSLKAQESKLLELLTKAEKLEDIIKIQEAISNCQYEINNLTGQIKRMDNQVTYSTLSLEIREVIEYSEIKTQPKNFGEKIAESFKRSGEQIIDLFSGILFFAIEDLPVLLIILGILLLIAWIIASIIKKISYKKKTSVKNDYANTYQPPKYNDIKKEINEDKEQDKK